MPTDISEYDQMKTQKYAFLQRQRTALLKAAFFAGWHEREHFSGPYPYEGNVIITGAFEQWVQKIESEAE